MPRKQKTVYEKINTIENKIKQLEEQLKEQKLKLVALNKEKDEFEMNKMFTYIKEHNLEIDEAIKAINVFMVKQKVEK